MSGRAAPVWVVASPSTVKRWGRALRAGGIMAMGLPWSQVRPAPDPEAAAALIRSGRFELILFTSAHAPAVLPADIGAGHRCACVGERTAVAARARGFDVVLTGDAGAGVLASRLWNEGGDPGPVLIVRGRESHDEAGAVFRDVGVEAEEVIAYVVDEDPSFPRRLAQAAGAPVPVVVVGSPRALQAFERAWDATRPSPRFVVPGPTTSLAAERSFPGRVHIAERANPESIVAAVRSALDAERNATS